MPCLMAWARTFKPRVLEIETVWDTVQGLAENDPQLSRVMLIPMMKTNSNQLRRSLKLVMDYQHTSTNHCSSPIKDL